MTHVPEVLTGVSIRSSLQGFPPVLVSVIYPPARAWIQSGPAQRNPTADPSVAAAASEARGSSPLGPGAPAAPAHDAPTARAGEGGDPRGAAGSGARERRERGPSVLRVSRDNLRRCPLREPGG